MKNKLVLFTLLALTALTTVGCTGNAASGTNKREEESGKGRTKGTIN